MSSESLTDELGRIDTYAFEQLDAPFGSVHNENDLLASAWAEAERIREQARLSGEAEGHAAGLAEAREEIESALAALNNAIGALEDYREELTATLEHDAAELAFRISEQILSGALAVEPERVIDVARNALRRVTDRRRVVLVVNPADLEAMGAAVSNLQSELGGIEHCDVQSDRRVQAGGVILRTEAGEIDATLETALAEAREIVIEVLRSKPDAG
jgi:flagellar assembly protein FliH